jgi:hypothetical protein
MSRSSNVILAGGVFVVVFAGAWWGLPHLTPKAPADEPMAFANKPAEVAGTMLDFVTDDPERERAGPMTEKQMMADIRGQEAKMTVVVLGMKGQKVSPEFIKAAQNDAPPNPSLVRHAMIDAGDGKKTACWSMMSDGNVAHILTTYSATHIDRGDSSTSLAQYIQSGCAQAMRDHSKVLSQVQYLQTMSGIFPKTSQYDKDRQDIAEAIRQMRQTPG